MTVRRSLAVVVLPILIAVGACSPATSSPDPSGSSAAPDQKASAGSGQTIAPEDQTIAPEDQTPGSLDPAPDDGIQTLPPRSLDQTAKITEGITAEVAGIERVTIKPGMPGDIAGPGVRVDVVVKNATGENVPLDAVQVNLYMGADKTPASPSSDSNNKPFPTVVKSGKTATGGFAFLVPNDKPFKGTVEVLFAGDQKVVVFSGPIN